MANQSARTRLEPPVETGRIGLELVDWLDLSGRVELAQWAETSGFTDVSVTEITDPDAFVTLALAGVATSTVRLATCIVQLGPRSVPMIASGAAAVQAASNGRFCLGIGVSSETIVRDWHGQIWHQRTIVRARESVQLLRSVLRGERTDVEGEQVRSHGFQLAFPPSEPPPIQLAALNKGMLRLAGELADGVWLNYVPVTAAEAVVDVVADAAAAAGRSTPEILLTLYADVTDDPASSREHLRDVLAFYMASPAYRRAFAWHGFEAEMSEVAEAFDRRDREAVKRGLTDSLVDSIALIGDADYVRERLERYTEAGVNTPSICPLDQGRLEETVAAFAPN